MELEEYLHFCLMLRAYGPIESQGRIKYIIQITKNIRRVVIYNDYGFKYIFPVSSYTFETYVRLEWL